MTTTNPAIAVLTFKSRSHILSVGGTCSWALNRQNAKKYGYVVCTRNANTRTPEGPEDHASAFIVARIDDIVPSPENPNRWLITFAEYAETDIPNVWGHGWRNPVRYTTLEDLGINLDSLSFQPMPEVEETTEDGSKGADTGSDETFMLTIAQAKEGLSATFGVPVEAIEIVIRG